MEISREELFDLVWAKPMTHLAGQFGISDVALAKKCRKLGIPCPERGYWARVQAGWKAKKPRLPNRKAGQADSAWFYPKPAQDKKMEVECLELSDVLIREIEALKMPENRVIAGSDFDRAHKFVTSTRRLLRAGRLGPYGQLYSVRNGKCLSVYVGPESLDRTLLIFDAILRTLERHKFKVRLLNESGEKGTFISRDCVEMRLSATEKSKRSDHIPTEAERKAHKEYSWRTYPKWDYAPSGQIEFVLSRSPMSERRWRDLKSRTIEEQLTEIACVIIESPERITAELAKRGEERIRELENRRLELERRRREAEEQARLQELVQQAEQWTIAEKVRAYLAACTKNLESADMNDEQREEWADWLKWGCEHANRIDPLKNGSQACLMARTLNPPDGEVETYEVEWRSHYR